MMGTATREAYGKVLAQELVKDPKVVVLDAELEESAERRAFRERAPERYFGLGSYAQDMMGLAASLASCGKIPFASAGTVFSAGRALEQVRSTIAYPRLNVKITATHADALAGGDGGAEQSAEDIALMRSLPNMTVISPSDEREAEEAIKAAAQYYGPVYIRLGRTAVREIHGERYQFNWNRGEVLREGEDVGIIATGAMVARALEAADALAEDGIRARVVNIHTIKPIDRKLVVETAQRTGKIVTAEEHSVIGGLGSAVSEILVQEHPVKQAMVGIREVPGGRPRRYGLSAGDIARAAKML